MPNQSQTRGFLIWTFWRLASEHVGTSAQEGTAAMQQAEARVLQSSFTPVGVSSAEQTMEQEGKVRVRGGWHLGHQMQLPLGE